jgi:hypothetical protein
MDATLLLLVFCDSWNPEFGIGHSMGTPTLRAGPADDPPAVGTPGRDEDDPAASMHAAGPPSTADPVAEAQLTTELTTCANSRPASVRA